MWLDHDALAVGRGFRTNLEGVRQLRQLLEPLGVTVLDYDLPYFSGPEACLHLRTFISPVDTDLAVAYLPLMPTALCWELESQGVRLLEVPEVEFLYTQAANVLTVAPRRCIMLEGSPVTRRLLEEAGCEVATFPGEPLSFKTEGGPTCLTQPVLLDRAQAETGRDGRHPRGGAERGRAARRVRRSAWPRRR
jgi:N-dimethylarginine dimethylaminohydrolase